MFRLGATLIGSHAFGVLTNQLGIRAEGYKTEDIDVARREELALDKDIYRASVLLAGLVDIFPGAKEEATSAITRLEESR